MSDSANTAVAVGAGLLLGLAMLLIGSFVIWRRVRVLRAALQTAGTVRAVQEVQVDVSTEYDVNSRAGTIYHSYVAYTRSDGSTAELCSRHTREPSFAVGDRVRIRYIAASPQSTAEIVSHVREGLTWALALLLLASGFGLLGFTLRLM